MSEGARLNGFSSPGGKFIDTIDPEDPEYIKNLQRPAEVKEDMKQMEGRSRVSVVLNSQAFKEELEAVIHEQIRQGGPASLFALQQISDLLQPQSRGSYSSFSRSSPVIPINDIRGVETLGYSKQEKILRCKLASCYRLVDLFGWTHGVYNHISVRLSQEQEQFLVNPFGMLYSEITASTLVKVNVRGDIVDTGSTGLGINKASFVLHSAIHQARPDIRCIIHLHTPAAVAVSATKRGLLPISQEALICGKVSYHDYRGILVDQEEKDQLARSLGPFNKVMFLRNHGVVACGETVEEAYHYIFNLMAACEAQVKAMPIGIDNLILVDEETQEKTFRLGSQGGGGTDTSGRKWRCGELEWEAEMRTLDNSGYRTGHVYKQPLMKQEKKERINSDVEVPPASSSFTYVFDGDYEHSKYVSPIKMALDRQKQAYKAGWLTSPNTYKKEEIEEIGTNTPKKITKWVQDGETATQKSTAIKVENPNQFAPQGSNPKEFKQKQKSIRKDYYEEKVSAGPQSRILDGISWDEAAKMKEGGDQTVVVGAVSKGIIQRDHQHNAVVYRSYYSANPFENMSEDDVIAYKQQVEQHGHGEEIDDVPGPDGRLISTEERMQTIQRSQEDVQHDTEEDRRPRTNNDSSVNGGDYERRRERVARRSSPHKVTEAGALSRPGEAPPLAPQLQEVGLDQLVDTVVQAVMASALPASISKGQHCARADGREGGPIPDLPAGNFPHPSSPHPPPAASSPRCSVAVRPLHSDEMTKTDLSRTEIKSGLVTESSETPDVMTVQLEPTKLFQGKPGDGVVRISFSIQSKVTRRRTKGPRSSWPIENVTIMQSQPTVKIAQSAEEHQPDKKLEVLKEHQNIILEPSSEEKVPTLKVPASPTYLQKQMKRPYRPPGRRQGAAKLAKPRKKFPRWSRRGLTHPLSPVKEEFLEGDDFLEALLARQNVEMDSDESLEDLLLMTDNYKENLAPSHKHDVREGSGCDTAAPIATVEDLDELAISSSVLLQQELQNKEFYKMSQEPVFASPGGVGDHQSPNSLSQTSHEKSDPSADHGKQGDTKNTDSKNKNIEEELRFVDEEVSNTYSEASDGDIAPRKQEEGLLKMNQTVSAEIRAPLALPEKHLEQAIEKTSDVESHSPVCVLGKGDDEHLTESGDMALLDVNELQTTSDIGRKDAEGAELKESGEASVHDHVVTVESDSTSLLSLLQKEDSAGVSLASGTSREKNNRPVMYRTDSASLEKSPIVSSPPSDSFPSETICRELHRVRSLEKELDNPIYVKRRLNHGHAVVRRVQSAGPSTDNLMSKNRNVAVIDAVLHTVTIDPAKMALSGRPVSEYLAGSSTEGCPSSDKQKKWTLMDSVSKSLENLDVDELVKDGTKIYGRSLEVLIHDNVVPEQLISPPNKPHEEADFEDSKEVKVHKGTKLYKDDVVVVTKAPLDFSAISPQLKKDIADEEGPLVTSSPKLGRRKEGSFKKYQSKMGKSEETLLEVSPLSSERVHQSARRSKSFPKNYGLMKNRSREGLLDQLPLLKSDEDKELQTSTQSMPILDEGPKRSARRNRSRQTRNSDPSAFSHETYSYQPQVDTIHPKRHEKQRSEESVSRESFKTDRNGKWTNDFDENEREEDSSRHHLSPEGEKEHRRRRRTAEEDKAEAKQSAMNEEGDLHSRHSARRERRRRRRDPGEAVSGLHNRDVRVEPVSDTLQDKSDQDGGKENNQDGRKKLAVEETVQVDRPAEVEAVPPPMLPSSGTKCEDSDEFPPPPPPEELYHEEYVDGMVSGRPSDDTQLPRDADVFQDEDEDEENQPPRVRGPRKKEHSKHVQNDQKTADSRKNLQTKDSAIDPGDSASSTFLSSFTEPVKTVVEDFPSLLEERQTVNSASEKYKDEDHLTKMKGPRVDEAQPERPMEAEGTVPIAGNLDILDYSDEPPPTPRSQRRHRNDLAEDDEPKMSRARQRAERRRRDRSKDYPETEPLRKGSDSGSARGNRRGSRDSQGSRTSYDIRDYTASRDSLSGRNKRSSKDNLASRESLALKEAADLDIISFDSEPPKGRRDRRHHAPNNNKTGSKVADVVEATRWEGRVKGRRNDRKEGRPESDKVRRNVKQDDEKRQSFGPEIRVQAASRESLENEDWAPPLPPKQYRSMDRLSEYSLQSRRSKSREVIDDIPPELPPKKNKKKNLSCVSGAEVDTENQSKVDKKEKKTKDRSSSKERKRLPQPPPPPPLEEDENDRPRRRHRQQGPRRLQVPTDESFHRDSSFDVSYDQDRQGLQSGRRSGSYYGDTDGEMDKSRKDAKLTDGNTTMSPPQTPRPARKISTSSFGSSSARVARSVSFDDGYTPTMSHPPHSHKSRESLISETSLHSNSYRMRSYSGASEASLSSNPLNYEPWRVKAASQRQHSRPRRSRSQGEPTYSANAGRRRRSRTPNAGDANRLYQPRRTRSRSSLPDAPSKLPAPSQHNKSRDTSTLADDSFSDAYSHGYASESQPPVAARRSEARRQSERTWKRESDGDKLGSPARSDASGGETLEDRSSKEGSPTKEVPSPSKDKKKKKKFHIPSFSKKKKDSKESTI